jgi:hypothetical protein
MYVRYGPTVYQDRLGLKTCEEAEDPEAEEEEEEEEEGRDTPGHHL